MRVVGVFGGSFSPVHTGHLEVVMGILDKGLTDEVWLLPCRLNPFKAGNKPIEDKERLRMLNAAVDYICKSKESYRKKIKISDIELTMPSPSYTFKTLNRLKEMYPDTVFRIVAGADSYLNFEKWREWEWIENNFSPIVYPRPGFVLGDVRNKWTLLSDVKLTDISSTQLRTALACGRDVSRFMPWVKQ